ncbi:hypothetical protein D5086_024714 [Populus alba]|uniref:Uncharacterized protein n=1 Tax=Populus alba TaxID=43335 RepID=A0ACC4B749_POPAL
MLTLSPKAPFLYQPQNPNPKIQHYKPQINGMYCKSELQSERGLEFETGETFFRHESAKGRDLAEGYFREFEESRQRFWGMKKMGLFTHLDANRVLSECYLQKDFFDLIDIDSFGSDISLFLRSAMNTLSFDGLLYVTSTDGHSSERGHILTKPCLVVCLLNLDTGILESRRYVVKIALIVDLNGYDLCTFMSSSLAAFGAYVRPMPYSNEVGLRMLIGIMVSSPTATIVEIHKNFHGLNLVRFSCSCSGNHMFFPQGSRSLVYFRPVDRTSSYVPTSVKMIKFGAEEWGWDRNGAETESGKTSETDVGLKSDPRLKNLDTRSRWMSVGKRAKNQFSSTKDMMSAMHKRWILIQGEPSATVNIAATIIFDVEEEPRVELLEEKSVFPVKVKRVDAGEQDYMGMVHVAIPKAIPVSKNLSTSQQLFKHWEEF